MELLSVGALQQEPPPQPTDSSSGDLCECAELCRSEIEGLRKARNKAATFDLEGVESEVGQIEGDLTLGKLGEVEIAGRYVSFLSSFIGPHTTLQACPRELSGIVFLGDVRLVDQKRERCARGQTFTMASEA